MIDNQTAVDGFLALFKTMTRKEKVQTLAMVYAMTNEKDMDEISKLRDMLPQSDWRDHLTELEFASTEGAPYSEATMRMANFVREYILA